jgi:hypothetical protein
LRIGITATKRQIVLAESPYSVGGRHPTILKNSGEWPLRAALRSQAQCLIKQGIRILTTDIVVPQTSTISMPGK